MSKYSHLDMFYFKASNCNVCGYNIEPVQVKVKSMASRMATKIQLSQNPKPLLFIHIILCLLLGAIYN